MQYENVLFLNIWLRILGTASIILIIAVYPNYVLDYSVGVMCKKYKS